ncbi:MAG: homocysteine S-methyltransferase family protein [Ignavibacteriales bacterium]|nr:homocysteine S-methyltransferase family protein [Ignavibacteriales bacterium]
MNKLNFLSNRKATLNRPLILDGAFGSVLQQRGFSADKDLWFSYLSISEPQAVLQLHKEYVDAGADIITTNTFRTNPSAKKKSNLAITNSEFVKRSVTLAIQAKGETDIIIAGSNAPAEDCYQKERTISLFDLEYNHKKHIELLYESGCDIIWNETHSHLDEIEIICKFCSENSIPYSINIYFDESLKLLSGEHIDEAIRLIENFPPQAIGFNCIKPIDFEDLLDKIQMPVNFGFYLNCGSGAVTAQHISCGVSPESYVGYIKEFARFNPTFVGSCCGSNPAHTKAIKEYFDEAYRN